MLPFFINALNRHHEHPECVRIKSFFVVLYVPGKYIQSGRNSLEKSFSQNPISCQEVWSEDVEFYVVGLQHLKCFTFFYSSFKSAKLEFKLKSFCFFLLCQYPQYTSGKPQMKNLFLYCFSIAIKSLSINKKKERKIEKIETGH